MADLDKIWLLNEEGAAPLSFLSADFAVHEISVSAEPASAITFPDNTPNLIVARLETLKKVGPSVIIRMGESGIEAKIACICPAWPSQEAIFYLTNLLKTSLILIEPVIPNLAIAAIRELLAQKVEEAEISDFQNSQENHFKEPEHISPAERQIAETIASLRLEAANEWRKLRVELEEYKQDSTDETKRMSCQTLAHQLKGCLGSLGLKKTSKNASAIEYCLRHLKPQSSDESLLYWCLLEKLIDSGDSNLDLVDQPESTSLNFSENNIAEWVLLIGRNELCAALSRELKGAEFSVRTVDDIDQLDAFMEDGGVACAVVCSALSNLPKFEIGRYLQTRYPQAAIFDYCRQREGQEYRQELWKSFGIEVLCESADAAESIIQALKNKPSRKAKSSDSIKRKDINIH